MDRRDVFITVGLPGCGKSSFAKFTKNFVDFLGLVDVEIIERDEIRNELFELFEHGSDHVRDYYSSRDIRHKEDEVTRIYMERFYGAHENGVDVIILSDTFMNCKHLETFVDLANNLGRKVWVYDFTYVPLDKIYERNKKRENRAKIVDENVIERMARKINGIRDCISRLNKEGKINHIIVEKGDE